MTNLLIFMANDGTGGVQNGTITLCKYLSSKGLNYQLICVVKKRDKEIKKINIQYLNSKSILYSTPKILNIMLKKSKGSKIICGQPHLNLAIIFINIILLNKHKIYVTEHNPSFKVKGFKNIIIEFLKIYFYKFSESIICVSEPIADQLRSFKIIQNKDINVVYNPVNIKKFQAKKITKRSNNNINMIFVGRLCHQKNLELLLNSLTILKAKKFQFRVNIVGDGEKMHILRNLRKSLSLENEVKFLYDRKNINILLNNSDIFVLPSKYEGFCIAMVEAMLCGLQIVSTNTEGPKEILQHSEYGFLTKFDPYSFCQGMIDAIERPKRKSNIIKRAQYLVNPEKVWDKYQRILKL